MAVLTPAQQDTLDALRSDPADRPAVDRSLRHALQHELDAATAAIGIQLTVTKHKLTKVHQCEGNYLAQDHFSWRPANAKGTIAHKAIELSVGGLRSVTPTKLVEMACSRICESPETASLAEYLREIGAAEQAELRALATDLVIEFLEMFPPLQQHWVPHAEATTAAFNGTKRVVCRGKIDLKLGSLTGDRSNTVIIDMKTGNPSFSDMDDLRFYALLETLRTGVPPFQWANVYVGAGRVEVERYSETVMWSALRRLIDGVHKMARLDGRDAEPVLTPGVGCRFCPQRFDCDDAVTSHGPFEDQDGAGPFVSHFAR